VKGPTVLRRYYKVDPAETFDSEGFFRTGDLGHVDAEGRLCFGQRIKDTIKTGGINVSPADVEAKLMQIGGVAAAYAFPLPAGDRGEVVGAALRRSSRCRRRRFSRTARRPSRVTSGRRVCCSSARNTSR
jgi:acyl-CoA synthetase (AMP-forming)/AMP-acid ligase II